MSFEYKMFINGEWLTRDRNVDVVNPHTNERIGSLPVAAAEDVAKCVEAAHDARAAMEDLPAHKRSEILERTAQLIQSNNNAMTTRIVEESGKAWKWAAIETARAVENLKFAAEEAKRIHGETVPMDASPGSENRVGYWTRVPVGVVGAISPFNFPLNLVVHKVAPAIAAGNTIVLKPATATPGPAQLLGEYLLEAGLPAEALNIVYGSGSIVGEALVKNESVAKITFTGSVPVGKRIMQMAGLKKVTMELGSNSGTIIDESADIDLAVSRCIMGAFAYNGQVCIAVQRIYLHEKIAREFTEKFVQATRKIVVGDPMNPETDVTAMITEQEAMRAEAWVQEAVATGAKALCGGKREGRIYQPTVLSGVAPDMKVICDEVFAPIVSLITFSDFDDALRQVDESLYGLQAGVFTNDIKHAFQAVKRIDVGGVIINDVPTYRVDHMPYGGNKESGLGREGARFAIEEMTNLKMVCFNL